MIKIKISFTSLLLGLLFATQLSAQTDALPRSVPETEGVSSKGITAFLDAAAKSKTEFHSFMLLRHGKVVAEGWWNPYSNSLKHTMYSTSKSFTATAVGFAISEKLIKLDDKVVSFFPDELPSTVSPNLAALTVKDVLSMSDGQDPDPTGVTVTNDSNWVKSFLATPVLNKPGSTFLYNSLGTYMLSAIVQKVTGKKIIDYLRPRLFEPLGIQGMDWEVDPKGINTGGWGLRIKTEDMAKFGQLFLQKGKWNGKQILPAGWAEEASTAKIIQHPQLPQSKRDSSDWEQGYCYQMWRCRHNAFRGDGAFGQFIIVMPEKDAVMAITAETKDMQEEINLVWDYILPALRDDKLPADNNSASSLKEQLSKLALPAPASATSTPAANEIAGKVFTAAPNDEQIEKMSFQFNNNICHLALKTSASTYQFDFTSGKWQPGETTMSGPYLLAKAKAKFVGLPPFKVDGAYSWIDDHTLELTLRYVESPHTEKITCHFNGNMVAADFSNSTSPDKKTVMAEVKN